MPTVLLLGASRGIGLELARQFKAQGWRVVATARSAQGLELLDKEGCETHQLDVTDPVSHSRLAWVLDGEKLQLVVYVAGVIDRAPAPEPPSQAAFDHVMHTNVWGAMQTLPQILPMVASAHGVVACISSAMGSLQDINSSSAWLYRVSKAALNMVVRCIHTAQPDITAVALHPGWVQTEMGGPQATLTPVQSARSLCATLTRLCTQPREDDRGSFFNHDGTRIAW
ncbi:MAG: C-factor [Pseudomonadota bacterium]|jgi:NAD(P)-dependent dehydrogenase (short-subunit alcohol dehydrogenase family)